MPNCKDIAIAVPDGIKILAITSMFTRPKLKVDQYWNAKIIPKTPNKKRNIER